MSAIDVSGHTDGASLPNRLSRVAAIGARLSGVAAVLVILAFLTDPTPTKDLPGVGLPVTLPVSQPDLGHSVASYFVGMWLWEFTFPLLVLAAYDRLTLPERWVRRLLVGLPAVYMGSLLAYCSLVYVPLVSPAPLGPAATAVCWAFCATGKPLWGGVTAAITGVGLLAWVGPPRHRPALAVVFGALALPLGVPALYWGYTELRDSGASAT